MPGALLLSFTSCQTCSTPVLFKKALDCKTNEEQPLPPLNVGSLLSSVLGFICRFPARHLESWLVMALDFQCNPNLNFSESGVSSSLAHLCLLVFG